MRIQVRRTRFGMTLAEVLVAVALLAVGVLALVSVFPAAVKLDAYTASETSYLYAAQSRMDALVAANAFVSTSYTTDPPLPQGGTRRWRGLPDPYGNASVQVIEVDVNWTQMNRPRSITLYGQVAP